MSAGAERFAVRSTAFEAFALVVFLAGLALGTSLTQVGAQKHIISIGLFCATGGAK
jgi:hypothetical protein